MTSEQAVETVRELLSDWAAKIVGGRSKPGTVSGMAERIVDALGIDQAVTMIDKQREKRWTLIVCPECGLQAPLGYECSGGGDCGKGHSLNVPVVTVEVVSLERALRAEKAARDATALAQRIVAAGAAQSGDPRLWIGETMDALCELLARHPDLLPKS